VSRRLYIETNFVMAFAKGQDRDTEDILSLAERGSVDLVLPEVCVMETFKAWEREKARTAALTRRLQQQIDEYGRRETVLGPSAAAILDNARVQADKQLNTVRARAARCLERIANKGSLVPLSPRWIRAGAQPLVIAAEADDMILATVVDHMETKPGPAVGFLTNNVKDFKDPAVRSELKRVGAKRFLSTKSALAWLQSGTSVPDTEDFE
jgi:transposase InsO family protein